MVAILAACHFFTTDALRRAIESLTPTQYETWMYYKKWSAGMAILLLETGVIDAAELQNVMFGKTSNHNDHDDTSESTPLHDVGDTV